MIIEIIPTTYFTKEKDNLLKKDKLLEEDYQNFKNALAENPLQGDVIPKTGGARKIRLASGSKGKRGGSRACYFYHQRSGKIYLLMIYPKNVKEDLLSDEIKFIKKIIAALKRKLDEET